jgi:Ni2+-binding GTPase involved in maturation of urease and hydrogenase
MIERALVHVGGPPGSGKTTFIEAMLAGADALTLAARCLRHDTLTEAR